MADNRTRRIVEALRAKAASTDFAEEAEALLAKAMELEAQETVFSEDEKSERSSRWEAVRNGDIYCAPACGFKCKWEDYQQACEDAKRMCDRLGAGWHVRVWENGGWHWKVLNGPITLSPNKYMREISSWSAQTLLNAGTTASGQVLVSAETPESALENLRNHLSAMSADCLASIMLATPSPLVLEQAS